MSLRVYPPRAGKSRFWTVRGTFAERTVNASTKATDKEGAEKFKAGLEVELARQAGAIHAPTSFKAATDMYIDFRDPSHADRAFLKKIVAVIGHVELADMTQQKLVEGANLVYRGAQASTKNRNFLTPAAAVMHYASDSNLCPYIRVRKFKEKEPEPRSVVMDIARTLLANAKGDMLKALAWLFCQGWRISDTLRVQWPHLDLKAGTVRYRIRKTDKWRMKPIHSDVLALLCAAPRDFGPVFPWKNRHAFYRSLRPLCAKLGIRFTPHMARHSFATWRINDGVSLKEIMDAGGWESMNSVLRYAKLDATSIRSAVDRVKL